MASREELRGQIDADIRAHGWHHTTILPGPLPGWSYTIGLTETFGAPELVVAGRGALDEDEVRRALVRVVEAIVSGATPGPGDQDEGIGGRFGSVHRTWRERLLLGAEGRYGPTYDAQQFVPSGPPTIDVPDLAGECSAGAAPAWRWLDEPWPYAQPPFEVAAHALVRTDLDALAGAPAHEVARVRTAGAGWECWASDQDPIPQERQRIAPLGLFLAVDPTFEQVLDLEVGEWATRSSATDPWEAWSA